MAGTESLSFCGPMLPAQPPPPMAQAPMPIGLMRRSLFPSGRCSMRTSKALREMVVQIVPAQFFPEIFDLCIAIDQQIFDACHLGEILQVFGGEGAAEGSVVGSAGKNPRGRRDFQIWFR